MFLELTNVTKKFGALVATNDVSLHIEEGECRGLIGPNGAGKTTLFNQISGFLIPNAGKILFRGEDITRYPPHKRVKRGIVRTWQLNNLYKNMSVLENIAVSRHIHIGNSLTTRFLSPLNLTQDYMKMAEEILEVLELWDKRNFLAGALAHGEQRRLGIAMAMATEPRLLMLDEPFTGMISTELEPMIRVVKNIHAGGTTIVIVEHNVKSVFQLCKKITVLEFGAILKEGTPEEVVNDPQVIEAYLGTGTATGDLS